MKKTLLCALLALFVGALTACSEQTMTFAYGGKMTHNLPEGVQLIGMTWKDTNLWTLYYDPKTKACVFAEASSLNVLEGAITVPNCNPAMLPKQ